MNKLFITNQPASKSLITAILHNTEDQKPVKLRFHLTNGMEIQVPNSISVMFSHKALKKLLKS